MDRDTLRQVRDAVLEQHRRRYGGSEPPTWWRERVQASASALLAAKVADLVDVDPLIVALETSLDSADVQSGAQALARLVLRELAARLGTRAESLADVAGKDTLAALDELLARPDVVDEALLADLARDEALERVMQDVLFDALKEFSERVNPFVADWGLPALLDQLPLFGKGTLRKAFDAMRGDFDKRLEPEIRKFLKTFARKSLERMVELTLKNRGEPGHVAMRQHLARTLLERPLRDLCWPVDDPRLALAERVTEAAISAAASHALVRGLVTEAVRELHARWRERSVAEVLAELDIPPPPLDPWVDASWPLARTLLTSEPLLAELASLLDEAHEAFVAS